MVVDGGAKEDNSGFFLHFFRLCLFLFLFGFRHKFERHEMARERDNHKIKIFVSNLEHTNKFTQILNFVFMNWMEIE